MFSIAVYSICMYDCMQRSIFIYSKTIRPDPNQPPEHSWAELMLRTDPAELGVWIIAALSFSLSGGYFYSNQQTLFLHSIPSAPCVHGPAEALCGTDYF